MVFQKGRIQGERASFVYQSRETVFLVLWALGVEVSESRVSISTGNLDVTEC